MKDAYVSVVRDDEQKRASQVINGTSALSLFTTASAHPFESLLIGLLRIYLATPSALKPAIDDACSNGSF